MSQSIVASKSSIHGNGVFALTTIAKGQSIIEYRGRKRSHAEVDRLNQAHPDTGHTFLFTLNEDYVIDASQHGNIARWINHSCEPNCQAVMVEDPHGHRHRDKILIEAIRTILPGEELTYNYGICLAERHTQRLKRIWACHCGSRRCTGTLLQPKRSKG